MAAKGDNELELLRHRIRALGVAKVAQIARIAPTTLYSFCQDPTRQIGYKTARQVETVVIGLEVAAGTRHLRRFERHETVDIPIVSQSGAYAFQLGPDAQNAQADGELVFDLEPLRSWSGGKAPSVIAIAVTGNELHTVLKPADVCVVDTHKPVPLFNEDNPYLVRAGDRLVFAHCRKTSRKSGRPVITFDSEPTPALEPDKKREMEILGRVRWVSRFLDRPY